MGSWVGIKCRTAPWRPRGSSPCTMKRPGSRTGQKGVMTGHEPIDRTHFTLKTLMAACIGTTFGVHSGKAERFVC